MQKEKILNRVIWLSYSVVMLAYVASCIWGQKYLYADGAMGSFSVFTRGDFVIYPLGRKHFDIICQMWPVISYRLGCRNYSTLGFLYSFGLTGMTAITTGITLLISQKRNKVELGLIAACITVIQILFMGHYVIVESLFGVTVFFQEVVLYLVHEDEKSKLAYAEYLLILFHLFFTIHLMEYYVLWAPVLIVILIFRIFFSKRNGLSKIWLLVAFWQGFIAVRSYIDIGARGEAPGLYYLLSEIIQREYYVQMCLWMAAVVIISIIWNRFFAATRNILLLTLIAMYAPMTIRLLYLAIAQTDMLVVNSSALRWTNIPWGVAGGLFLLVLSVHLNRTSEEKIFLKTSYAVFFMVLCVSTACYEKITAERQRDYHDQVVAYCELVHPGEGFIDIAYTDFRKEPLLNYSNPWVSSYQCVDLFALKGKKEITTILFNAGKGDEMLLPETYSPIQQFGLRVNIPAD